MDKIYQWLINNKDELMNKFIYKMIPNKRDAEDFYQDLFIIMAGKNEQKLNQILERTTEKNNEMMRYVYIIIKNNLKSKNSRYYYTYRKHIGSDYDECLYESYNIDTTENKNLLEELNNDYNNLMEKISEYFTKELNKNPRLFYDKTIFEMYYNQKNTYRKMSETLNIPITSIFNTVKKLKGKIEKEFKVDIKNIKEKIIYYGSRSDY